MTDFENTPASKMSISKRGLVCGVGVNDATFVTTLVVEGHSTLHPGYSTWLNMLKRCYSKEVHLRRPTYGKTVVCPDWLKFSSFLSWWKLNHVTGWVLDKDILGDGTIYSPTTCVYVPMHVNNFIEASQASRGDWPIGVSKTSSGKFHAYCRNNRTNKRVNLGYFDTADEASNIRLNYKLQLLEDMRPELDLINPKLFTALQQKVRNIV